MLKQKVSAPAQEVVLPDFPDDDTTFTTTVTKSRRVSFGPNFVKEFIADAAASAQCMSEYEQPFPSSDSSGADSSHSAHGTFLLHESSKAHLDASESRFKQPKFASTICFSSDSPTADMEFTEGCINLAKTILDKKNKEMSVFIQAKSKEPKQEERGREEETNYFEESQFEMSMTGCQRFAGGEESVEDTKDGRMLFDAIMRHLDKDSSDMDLFNPEKAIKRLGANPFEQSDELDLNESMEISGEVVGRREDVSSEEEVSSKEGMSNGEVRSNGEEVSKGEEVSNRAEDISREEICNMEMTSIEEKVSNEKVISNGEMSNMEEISNEEEIIKEDVIRDESMNLEVVSSEEEIKGDEVIDGGELEDVSEMAVEESNLENANPNTTANISRDETVNADAEMPLEEMSVANQSKGLMLNIADSTREPLLADLKVIESLKEQSKEPGCMWSLKELIHPGIEAEGLLSFSCRLLDSTASVQFALKMCEEINLDSCSIVTGSSILLDEEKQWRLPEYSLVVGFGFEQLRKHFEGQRQRVEKIRHVPYFLDQVNSFVSKMNAYLRQTYSVLTLYPGSRLLGSKLSFRLFSFPIFFSCVVTVDLGNMFRLSKASLSLEHDFGSLDERVVREIFEECLKGENCLCEFVVKTTRYLVELERESGYVSKRGHIRLLPEELKQ